MPRRTLRELAAENAVLFGKLEGIRDDLEEFLSDEETEPDDGFPDEGTDRADDGAPDGSDDEGDEDDEEGE